MTEPHSATVKLALVVDGTEYPLAQVGPGFLVTRGKVFYDANGELVTTIDGVEERKQIKVYFPWQLEGGLVGHGWREVE